MDRINLSKASKLTSPNPLTLVCTEKPSGETNIMAASWWTYLSFTPGIIGFSLAKTSYSGELIQQTKEAILAMPGAALTWSAMQCGSFSGRDVNKVKQFHIEMQPLPNTSITIPVHSYLAIQCTLAETLEVGDHIFYICTVDCVYGNDTEEALFAWDGYAKLGPAKY